MGGVLARRPGRTHPAAAACGLLAATLLLVASARPVSAQERPSLQERGRLDVRSSRVAGGRIDRDRAVWRARYGPSDTPVRVPVRAPAGEVIDRLGPVLGIPLDRGVLALERDDRIGPVRHVRFRQVVDGVPVLDRYVAAAVDGGGRVTFAVNGYDYDLAAQRPGVRPALAAEAARERAADALSDWGGRIGPASLVVVPGPEPRLAYAMYAWPDGDPSEWRVLIDATTGELIGLRDETVTKSEGGGSEPGGRDRPALAAVAERASASGVTTDGAGAIFDPDPLATSGAFYGAPFWDSNDDDIPELNAERIPVQLPDITRGNDGLYRLSGPYVTIVGENSAGSKVYDPPAKTTAFGFSLTRADPGFEAVMAYYHLDMAQRYIQSLGFTDLQATPLPVNPAGTAADESGWIAGLRYLFFGTGGVDDGEDAFVLWHEYAHAILEAGAPGLRTTAEGRALHEGWSDYWAASYQKWLIDQGDMQRTDWERTFRWDTGDGAIWPGRTLDHTGVYPQSICSANPGSGACSPHNDGRLWATVLMEIHQELGRELTDRLNLLSHRYLSAPVTFADAAAAVVQADIDHYGGEHVDVLVQHFAPRGLVDASEFWPSASHEPLRSIESVGGTVKLDVEAVGVSAPIAEVTAVYRYGSGPDASIALGAAGDAIYRGDLPVPASPDSVHYWIRVRDALNRTVLLPEGAPGVFYSFYAGPDTVPPDIAHDPVTESSVATWPPVISALITDGLGVAGATVDYTVAYADGTPSDEGSFPLVSDGSGGWSGALPTELGKVRHGSVVTYVIRATDTALAANARRSPETGEYAFTVVGTGVLRLFQADGPRTGITTSGAWEAGEPRFGVLTSPLGGAVWATGAAGPYPATAGRSSLQLPALDLSAQDAVWLVFRHWYDIEHDGGASPGQTAGAVLWDGGNVKVSADGGATWSLLEPESGYSGEVHAGQGNPMAGEAAFGGSSYGWRQEIMPLPTVADVRIRFDFGTDESNTDQSVGFAGWYLDNVRISTERPVDTGAPFVTDAPPLRSVWPADGDHPFLSIQVGDDTGVADVFVAYTWTGREGTDEGIVRLPMASYDLSRFEAELDPGRAPAPNDRIEVWFVVRDLAGNEIRYPDDKTGPVVLEIMSLAVADLLDSARPSGGWERRIEGWTVSDGEGALVLAPMHLADNGTDAVLELDHYFYFGLGQGGRAELSSDDGATWSALEPETGYPAAVEGVAVWTGVQTGRRTDRFDLTAWAGRSVQVRFSYVGSSGNLDQYWTVERLELVQQTGDEVFDPVREPTLHANFPDPFTTSTNISVTLPELDHVSLAVYDVLGRRVAVLLDGTVEAGTHAFVFDTTGLAPGAYLLRLDAGGRTYVERMIRTR